MGNSGSWIMSEAYFKKGKGRPCGLVAKTPHSQGGGLNSIPGQATKSRILHLKDPALAGGAKNFKKLKKKKNKDPVCCN